MPTVIIQGGLVPGGSAGVKLHYMRAGLDETSLHLHVSTRFGSGHDNLTFDTSVKVEMAVFQEQWH